MFKGHTNGDVVVIIDHDQVAQLQMASSGGSLAGNTLHSTAITKEAVCVVVDQVIAGFVEHCSSVLLGDGETDSIGETLAKRTSGDFNAGCVVGFGMAWSNAVDLLLRG